MANIKSQIKRNKTNEKAHARFAGTETEADALRLAMKKLDKAASKGIIHKNQAANRKSGLMKKLNALKG